MALALRHSDAGGPPPGWITCSEAAARVGVSVRAMQLRCESHYRKAGLAGQYGGTWHINPRADLLLCDGDTRLVSDREAIVQLRRQGVPQGWLDAAEDKRDLVLDSLAFDPAGVRGDPRTLFLAHCASIGRLPSAYIKRWSERQLSEWRRNYREDGFVGLVRKRKQGEAPSPIGDKARAYLTSMLLSGNGLSFRVAYALAQAEAGRQADRTGWHIGKLSTVRTAIGKLPRVARRLANKGAKSGKADCEPKLPRDFEGIAAGDEYNCDTCTIDVQVRYLSSRGWRSTRQVYITAIQDIRSRMIVGYVVKPYADSETILGSLKIAFTAHGKCLILRTDWGKDYRAATRPVADLRKFDGSRIASILDQLGVVVSPVTPYAPYTKPIESLFRTLHAQHDKMFPAYWGGSPEARHEDRQAWVDRNLEKLPTLRDYAAALAISIDTYHRTIHSAIDLFGKSPAEAMADLRSGPIRRESAEVLDHYFRRYTKPKLVRRDGIRHNGRWYGHGDVRLVAMQGETVCLGIQPDDASRAMVCRHDDDRTPLFEVECLSVRGMTDRDVREAKRHHRDAIKPFAALAKTGRNEFRRRSAMEHVQDYAAGVEIMQQGRGQAEDQSPSQIRLRSGLDEAIESAGTAPSDQASMAIRTGTDDAVASDRDDVTLGDVLYGDDGLAAMPPALLDNDSDVDFLRMETEGDFDD